MSQMMQQRVEMHHRSAGPAGYSCLIKAAVVHVQKRVTAAALLNTPLMEERQIIPQKVELKKKKKRHMCADRRQRRRSDVKNPRAQVAAGASGAEYGGGRHGNRWEIDADRFTVD